MKLKLTPELDKYINSLDSFDYFNSDEEDSIEDKIYKAVSDFLIDNKSLFINKTRIDMAIKNLKNLRDLY